MGGETGEAGGGDQIMGALETMAVFRNASRLKVHLESCF